MKAVFFPNREVITIQLMNVTLLVLVLIVFAYDTVSGVQLTALVATTLLATTLVPARLLGLKWMRHLQDDLLQISYQGKWLGIWTCVWYVLYTALALTSYYGTPFEPSQLLQRETVLLSLSILLFAMLLSLSNKWSYEHVKWWKQINMLVWLAVPFLFTHFLLAAHVFGGYSSFWAPWILLVLSAIAGVSGIFRHRRDYFAFWRLWLLLLGSTLSALVVWFYPAIL